MALYKQPIHPMDPIVPAGGQPEPIRYVRDNFSQTGQESNTQPPAQDQSLWQRLTNVMPVFQGVLSRRWGSRLLISALDPNGPVSVSHMFQYQWDAGAALRGLILTYDGQLSAGQVYREDGSLYSSLFDKTAIT